MEEGGSPYAIVSKLEAGKVHKRVAAIAEGDDTVTVRFAKAGAVAKAIGEGAIITEHVRPRPQLLVFGAGHVGQALAPIAATLPFRLSWLDTRPDFAGDGVTITGDPAAAIAAATPGSFFLIFTQSHALDYDLTRAVLARGDFAYCGLIGSATKRARFEKRLAADGIAPHTLARLICPIGAIGLASKLPQAMAVAVAAELLLALERRAQSVLPRKVQHAT
jgi:xanthine dehydrogenase accessory factor